MRQRFRRARVRAMAQRPDGAGRLQLSPRARWITGWLVAAAIIVGIAVVMRVLGGNADGVAVGPTATASPTLGDAASIRFGTTLDPATQEVAASSATDRFVEGDRFAYSFRPATPPPSAVWVEVRRGLDGSGEAVQEPARHELAEDALVIAFEVPAAALFRDFGPGPYQMRIYLEPDGGPAAVGSFELVVTGPSPSP